MDVKGTGYNLNAHQSTAIKRLDAQEYLDEQKAMVKDCEEIEKKENFSATTQ